MKYQKEFRWLAFLLIPFITLLTLDYLIPLLFALKGYAMGLEEHNTQNIQVNTVFITSTHLALQQLLQNTLSQEINTMAAINSLFTRRQALSINIFNKTIPNALKLQLNNTLINSTSDSGINGSMWYAKNTDQFQSLSTNQHNIYQRYSKIQPCLPNLLMPRKDSLIDNIFTFVEVQNSSMLFQYPLVISSQYINTILPNQQLQIMQTLSILKQNKSAIIPFISVFNNQSKNIHLCLGSTSPLQNSVMCASISIQKLQNLITKNSNNQLNLSFQLVLNSGREPDLSIREVIYSSGLQQLNASYLNITSQGFDPSIFEHKYNGRNNELYIFRNDCHGYYISPITIIFENSSTNIFNIIHQIHFQFYSLDDNAIDITTNIENLLIPIIILMLLSIVFAFIVLKKLIGSIDLELYELTKRCNHILEGDNQVQIPDFFGTKDIRQVYYKVKIINKLHKYSDQEYFVGHPATKLLKLNQLLPFFINIGYDRSAIIENMGECYYQLQDWSKALECYQNCLDLTKSLIEDHFQHINNFIVKKRNIRLNKQTQNLEFILIRRLFKTIFVYMRYFETKCIFQTNINNTETHLKNKSIDQLVCQSLEYVKLLKNVLYYQCHRYSQSIFIIIYEAKLMAFDKKFDEAKALIQKMGYLIQKYSQEYQQINLKLKQKGSKYKKYHQRYKMTFASRIYPEVLTSFKYATLAKIFLMHQESAYDYMYAFQYYIQSFKVKNIRVCYSVYAIKGINNLLQQLKIPNQMLKCTQIYNQVIPIKISDENSTNYQFIYSNSLKALVEYRQTQQRQFVILYDCSRYFSNETEWPLQTESKSQHIFKKLIKKQDRLSLIKFNSKYGIKIECSLLLKHLNETVLSQGITEIMNERNTHRTKVNELIQAFARTIWRIRYLKSEKVVIIFFRNITHYQTQRIKNQNKIKVGDYIKFLRTTSSRSDYANNLQEFGDNIVDILHQYRLQNCKIVLMCGRQDSRRIFIQYFGLQNINKRLWADSNGINVNNCAVFVIQHKHHSDIDRILMPKSEQLPDNNIFIL